MDKDVINRQIGMRIKKVRKEQGMTLLELARKVGLTEGTVQRYEAGNINNVAISTLEIFADALNTTPAYLMGWETKDETLSKKDEREIESDLEDIMNSVASAAYEDGADIEDVEAFTATIKAAMIQAKKIAKKKYTPKKYRKD